MDFADSPPCVLCGHTISHSYYRDRHRAYFRCPVCSLVFVPPEYHISSADEKAIYDLHENDPYDPGYREFHSRLYNPLNSCIEENSSGLDFGCGSGSALCAMLEEAGHSMEKYDKFFEPDVSVLEGEYDFICASEVVEHLQTPLEELTMLCELLKERGYLCIMTKMVTDRQAFSTWHYTHDRSHIAFFSRETFRFLADLLNARLTFPDRDVIFLQKL